MTFSLFMTFLETFILGLVLGTIIGLTIVVLGNRKPASKSGSPSDSDPQKHHE